MEIQTQWETLDVEGSPMSAFIAAPADGKKYPGVIVWMEIFGVNEHIQDVTRRLAKEGYVAIAPNYYHRVAPNLQLGYSKTDVEEGRQYKQRVSHQDMFADAQAVIRHLDQHPQVEPKQQYGNIGFCFGGYVAYLVATLPQVKVTASFYGAGIATDKTKGAPPVEKTPDIKGFIFCLFGEKDESIPASDIQTIETALEKAAIPHEIIVYLDAQHGFFCDKRGSYDPESAYSAWNEVKRIFKLQLKPTLVH